MQPLANPLRIFPIPSHLSREAITLANTDNDNTVALLAKPKEASCKAGFITSNGITVHYSTEVK